MRLTFLLILLWMNHLVGQFVCIHGLRGSSSDLSYIQNNLSTTGFDVRTYEYPSTEKTLKEHGRDLACFLQIIASDHPGKAISFITHSMGGIILRAAINDPNCPEEAKNGRVVQIAPPNQGCLLGRKYYKVPFVKWGIGKKAGLEVAKDSSGFAQLGQFPPSVRILVIAGRYDWAHASIKNPLAFRYNPLIYGENDGLIRVKETYLKTPHTHVVIDGVGHDSILKHKETLKYITDFLSSS